MIKQYQKTGFNQNFDNFLASLENWSNNPWRRYSLLMIVFFGAFVVGSSAGMINGVLALMDPVGAFFVVFILEILVRIRRAFTSQNRSSIVLKLLDSIRLGLLYGLFMEGFKLF